MERNSASGRNASSSIVVLREEEIEIELQLGLSIGGGYKRPKKLMSIKKEPVQNDPQTSNSNSDGSEANTCEKIHRHQNNNPQSCTRASLSPSFIRDSEQEIDLQMKREIQAARRQEAKKKREKKQKKKWMCKGLNGDNLNEFGIKERQWKRNKVGDTEIKNVNGKLTSEQNRNYNVFSNPMAVYIAPPMCPVTPMRNQLPPLQCFPVTNGFAYMMPCWAQSKVGVGSEVINVIRPVANRSAGPEQATSKSVLSLSKCSTSSTDSGNQSSSQQGGSSSNKRSHSNASLPEQNQKDDTEHRSEDGVKAHLLEYAESISKPKEEPISEAEPRHPSRNLVSTTPTTLTLRETKGNVGKPPKPVNSNPNTTPLPHMPCVSTTGKGPNGKTINGFLYKYMKSEVSIVCVCHGTTFSPAEFVQHAGGTDLSQPLRHITVIPFAF